MPGSSARRGAAPCKNDSDFTIYPAAPELDSGAAFFMCEAGALLPGGCFAAYIPAAFSKKGNGLADKVIP